MFAHRLHQLILQSDDFFNVSTVYNEHRLLRRCRCSQTTVTRHWPWAGLRAGPALLLVWCLACCKQLPERYLAMHPRGVTSHEQSETTAGDMTAVCSYSIAQSALIMLSFKHSPYDLWEFIAKIRQMTSTAHTLVFKHTVMCPSHLLTSLLCSMNRL